MYIPLISTVNTLNGATLKSTHTQRQENKEEKTPECSVANRPQPQANQNAATATATATATAQQKQSKSNPIRVLAK